MLSFLDKSAKYLAISFDIYADKAGVWKCFTTRNAANKWLSKRKGPGYGVYARSLDIEAIMEGEVNVAVKKTLSNYLNYEKRLRTIRSHQKLQG